MRFTFHAMVAAGCVVALAISTPASSRPAPRGVDAKTKSIASRVIVRLKPTRAPAVRRAVAGPPTTASIPAAVARTSHRGKPLFGWPALVVEARKYLGTNPTRRSRLWCATFMNFVLAKVGYAGTGSDAAKSFASYGRRISEPKVGAIAVLTRGKRGGHVGIVTGIDPTGNPIIISGNHGHRVGEGTYPRRRVIAYVMPVGSPQPTRYAALAGQAASTALMSQASVPPASDADSEGGIASPIAELLKAINDEPPRSERAARAPQPVPPARPVPPVPHRVVQQMPETTPARQRVAQHAPARPVLARRELPLDPALARLLGIKSR